MVGAPKIRRSAETKAKKLEIYLAGKTANPSKFVDWLKAIPESDVHAALGEMVKTGSENKDKSDKYEIAKGTVHAWLSMKLSDVISNIGYDKNVTGKASSDTAALPEFLQKKNALLFLLAHPKAEKPDHVAEVIQSKTAQKKLGVDIKGKGPNGNTLLHMALIQSGATQNNASLRFEEEGKIKDGFFTIFNALKKQLSEKELTALVNTPNAQGYTVLDMALARNADILAESTQCVEIKMEMVNALLKVGDVASDKTPGYASFKQTILSDRDDFTSKSMRKRVRKTMFGKAVDSHEIVDTKGNTPAHLAAEKGDGAALIKTAQTNGALYKKNNTGETPLHLAAGRYSTNDKDNASNTAFMALLHTEETFRREARSAADEVKRILKVKTKDHAIATSVKTAIESQVDKVFGAKPLIASKDKKGNTPLHICVSEIGADAFSEMMTRGARASSYHANYFDLFGPALDIANSDGDLPLHIVARKKEGAAEFIKHLTGQDLLAPGQIGAEVSEEKTAKNKELVEKVGVIIRTKNNAGDTPVDIVVANQNAEAFKYLVYASGCNISADGVVTSKVFSLDADGKLAYKCSKGSNGEGKLTDDMIAAFNQGIQAAADAKDPNKRLLLAAQGIDPKAPFDELYQLTPSLVANAVGVVLQGRNEWEANIATQDSDGKNIFHHLMTIGDINRASKVVNEIYGGAAFLDKFISDTRADSDGVNFTTALNAQDDTGKTPLYYLLERSQGADFSIKKGECYKDLVGSFLATPGLVIDDKSKELLAKDEYKQVSALVRDGLEAKTLKALDVALRKTDKAEALRLVDLIRAEGYDINRPIIESTSSVKRPVIHFLYDATFMIEKVAFSQESYAKTQDDAPSQEEIDKIPETEKYGLDKARMKGNRKRAVDGSAVLAAAKGKFIADRDEILEAIGHLPGFDVNVFAQGVNRESGQVNHILDFNGGLGKESAAAIKAATPESNAKPHYKVLHETFYAPIQEFLEAQGANKDNGKAHVPVVNTPVPPADQSVSHEPVAARAANSQPAHQPAIGGGAEKNYPKEYALKTLEILKNKMVPDMPADGVEKKLRQAVQRRLMESHLKVSLEELSSQPEDQKLSKFREAYKATAAERWQDHITVADMRSVASGLVQVQEAQSAKPKEGAQSVVSQQPASPQVGGFAAKQQRRTPQPSSLPGHGSSPQEKTVSFDQAVDFLNKVLQPSERQYKNENDEVKGRLWKAVTQRQGSEALYPPTKITAANIIAVINDPTMTAIDRKSHECYIDQRGAKQLIVQNIERALKVEEKQAAMSI